MSILRELEQHAPRIRLEGAFMEDGCFHIWAEAHIGDNVPPVKAHTKLPVDAGDLKLARELGGVFMGLVAKSKENQ